MSNKEQNEPINKEYFLKHTFSKSKLPIGSEILIINTPGASSFAFISLVRSGYKYVPAKYRELPHLLEHLAFEANKKFPKKSDFLYELDKEGVYFNAHTETDYMSYEFVTSKRLAKKTIEKAVAQISSPEYNPKRIKTEIEVVKNELEKKQHDDHYRCFFNRLQTLFPNEMTIQERIDSLKNANKNILHELHKKFHTVRNTRFIMAGDFSKKFENELTNYLNSELKDYYKGKKYKIIQIKLANYHNKVKIQKPIRKGQCVFECSFISKEHADKYDPILWVLNTIYNRGNESRMFKIARKQGLSYSPHSWYSLDKEWSEFTFADEVAEPKALQLFEIFVRQLAELVNGKFTTAELNRAKGFIRGSEERRENSPFDYVKCYMYEFKYDEKITTLAEDIKLTQKVTKDDIMSLKPIFFNPSNWLISATAENIQPNEFKKIMKKYFG